MLPPSGIQLHEPTSSTEGLWSSREIIDILKRKAFSDQDPTLQLDITDIRDRMAKFRNQSQSESPIEVQTRQAPIPASCSLTIWDSALVTMVEQTRKCNIYPDSPSEYGRHASIELVTPFLVPLRQLKGRTVASNGEITFSTQFVLMSVENTEVWPPINMQLPQPKNEQLRDDGSSFVRAPILVAKWSRLPHLPEKEEESLLELKAVQDDKTYKPKLSLKMNATWINPESVLTAYNREKFAKIPNGISNVPSKPKAKTVIQTEWVFEGIVDYLSKIVVNGYACPLCHNRTFCDPSEYHLHLLQNHDLFKIRYTIDFQSNALGQSIGFGTVRVGIAENNNSAFLRFQDFSWQRPQRPCDLEAFLSGDRTWIQPEKEPEPPKSITIPEAIIEEPISRESNRIEPKKYRKRAIEDIADIVITKKRKFKVPAAPRGFSFYRTISKVPLDEGDELSESDDDITEEWLLEKHADTIDSFSDTLPKEKLFIRKFDRHMLLEDPCSLLHAEEALIRFCTQNTAWLKRRDMRLEFAKKVATLRLNDMVSSEIVTACWRIIDDVTIQAEPEDDSSGKETVDSITTASQLQRPDRFQENEQVYGRCAKCRNRITNKSEIMFCRNGRCKIRCWHLSCAGITGGSRPSKWVCPSCKDNVSTSAVPAGQAKSGEPLKTTAKASPFQHVKVNGTSTPTQSTTKTPIPMPSAPSLGTSTASVTLVSSPLSSTYSKQQESRTTSQIPKTNNRENHPPPSHVPFSQKSSTAASGALEPPKATTANKISMTSSTGAQKVNDEELNYLPAASVEAGQPRKEKFRDIQFPGGPFVPRQALISARMNRSWTLSPEDTDDEEYGANNGSREEAEEPATDHEDYDEGDDSMEEPEFISEDEDYQEVETESE